MRSATVTDLRTRFALLRRWLDAGESIRITKRGVFIATLVPAPKRKSKAA